MFRILNRINASLRGWRALLAAVVVVAALTLLDIRILQSAPLYGIRPADADWVFSTGDFPSFWQDLESGDVFARIREDWPRPHADVERAIRLTTGVRPTPKRWRLWLGKRLTAATSPDGVGYCVYPGLPLRVVSRVAQALGRGPDAAGIAHGLGVHYTWIRGFLVFSPDRPYVEACLRHGDSGALRSGADSAIALHWPGPFEGYVRAHPNEGVPIEGRVRVAVSDDDAPLSLTNAWPVAPVASITARSVEDLKSLGIVADRALGAFAVWIDVKAAALEAMGHWNLQPAPLDWQADVEQVSLALLGIDTSEFLPIPDAAFVMRQQSPVSGDHPLRPLFADGLAIDYEWQGQPGVYIPWLGETLSPCLSGCGRDWIATLNEPAMASLVCALRPGPTEPPDVDVSLRISWNPAIETLKPVILHAAEGGLLPGYDEQEARSQLAPKMDALGKLGALQINARALEGGWLEFDGNLFTLDEPDDE